MLDVLVVGLGAMGSAALYHLAARGARVGGVDQFRPPHTLGSTHGRSRIIREAYYEHPGYVPLVRRAYANWSALERLTGVRLFEQTGGLMIGAAESRLVRGTRESAERHGIELEILDARDIAARFPALSPAPGMVGAHERRAGVLFPEACVEAHLEAARLHGAELRFNARVDRVEPRGDWLVAFTSGGEIEARRAILAMGPWAPALLATLGARVPLVVERQTMHWLEPAMDGSQLSSGHVPVTLVEHDEGRVFYAIPDFGDGMKAAIHYEGAVGMIDEVHRSVSSSDTAPVLELVRRFVAGAPARIRESSVCMYTNTPDLDFIVDELPSIPNVTLLSACSGHGFKFASALGEVVAQRVLGQSPAVDVSQFSLERLG